MDKLVNIDFTGGDEDAMFTTMGIELASKDEVCVKIFIRNQCISRAFSMHDTLNQICQRLKIPVGRR